MRGILIDPFAQEVNEVQVLDSNLATLRDIIGANTITLSGLGSGVKAVLDDVGLYREGQRYWYFDVPGGLSMMAGKALLLSMAPDGDLDALTHHATLDHTRSMVRWLGDKDGAEQAIRCGTVKRPAVTVNGETLWEWTPAAEGNMP